MSSNERKTGGADGRQMAAVIAAVVVAALIIFGGGAYLFTRLFSGATVRAVDMDKTMQLAVGEYTDPLEASGTIKAASGVSVSPKAEGTVKKVRVKDGDKVAKGDVLFTMDNDELTRAVDDADKAYQKAYAAQEKAQSGYDKAKANVKAAKKKLADAKAAFKKQQAAAASNAEGQPKTQLDTEPYDTAIEYAQEAQKSARETLATAKANAQAAKQSYEDAKAAAAKLTVKATVAGTVAELAVEPGMTTAAINAQGPALRIVDLETLVAVVTVAESQINSVRINQSATVQTTTASGDVKLDATVSKVADTPVSTPSDGAEAVYEVQLTIGDTSPQIKDGMAASAQIKVTDYGVVYYVPRSAVGDNGSNAYVEIVYNDKSTKQTQVTILAEVAGDELVIQGDELVKGMTVRTDLSESGAQGE